MKILSGYHVPEPEATIEVGGRPLEFPLGRAELRAAPIAFVHQNLALVADASVLDNVRIGRFETRPGWSIRWGSERERVAAVLERFGVRAGVDDRLGDLSQLDAALVAIARAFLDLGEGGDGVLVLDEPTAYMPREQSERLFDAVRAVAASGAAVIFVSHRIDEVLSLTDSVSVLRDGKLVETAATASLDADTLIQLIVGGQVGSLYPSPRPHRPGEVELAAEGLSGPTVRNLSLQIHRGEIVGLTGLRGMGHEEVPYLLFGAKRALAGALRLAGEETPAKKMTPRRAIGSGLVFLPADRERFGGVGDFSVQENVSLPIMRRLFRHGRLDRRAESGAAAALVAAHAIQPPDASVAFGSLSGGNQQRTLFAKWLQVEPTILMSHEPTAGVDAHAKKRIFEALESIAARGGGVLIASEEWEDVAHICDRVLVFRDGRVNAELYRGTTLTEAAILAAA